MGAAPVGAQRIVYVDDDAIGTGDGRSWATAYRFLQDALADAEAVGEPVEIRVAQGVYKPDRDRRNPDGGRDRSVFFRLNSGMSLLGGYAGIGADDPNRRDSETCQTVLSGDLLGNDAEVTDPATMQDDPTRTDNSSVMYIYGNGSRLDGCVITGGRSPIGALQAGNGSRVSGCTFRANCGDDYFPSSTGAVRAVPQKAPAVFEMGPGTPENPEGLSKGVILFWTTARSSRTTHGDMEVPLTLGGPLSTTVSSRRTVPDREGHFAWAGSLRVSTRWSAVSSVEIPLRPMWEAQSCVWATRVLRAVCLWGTPPSQAEESATVKVAT